jgi:hypothetical protein
MIGSGLCFPPTLRGVEEKRYSGFDKSGGTTARGHGIPEKDAGKLTVTARRLDAPAPPAAILKANSSCREPRLEGLPSRGNSLFDNRTLGSLEVSGRYEDDELTSVVWVSP